MTIIDADKFLAYLIFSKHIDGLNCGEVKKAIKMCKVDVLDKIRAEIEHIIDNTYDSTDYDKSLYNGAYKDGLYEALDIIDKYKAESEEAECDNNHDCEHCDWTECPLEVEKETDGELEALTEFLNDIEEVVQKHGWTIGMYDNLSENDSPSVIITFIPAIGYDSQFRKFGKESKPNE